MTGCVLARAVTEAQGTHVLLSRSRCSPILSLRLLCSHSFSTAPVPSAGTPGAPAVRLCSGESEGLVQHRDLPDHTCRGGKE